MKPEFNELLPVFIRKITHGKKIRFGQQVVDLEEPDPKERVKYSENHWDVFSEFHMKRHFSQSAYYTETKIYCGYAIVLRYEGDIVKLICMDADNKEQSILVLDKIIPWLKSHNIEYILEHSRAERLHLWICVDSIPYKSLIKFVNRIKQDCGLTKEVYPLFNKRNNLIRIPGGYHYWTDGPNPIEWEGEESSDPLFILKAFIACRPLTQEQVNELGVEPDNGPVERKQREAPIDKYLPLNLPDVFPDLPPLVKRITNNCLAHRRLLLGIKKVKDEPTPFNIQDPGNHDTGMAVSGLFLFNDIIFKNDIGRQFFNWLTEEFRDRDSKAHNWNNDERAYNKYFENPWPLIHNCSTTKDEFDLCGGCPYMAMDGFHNPRQLYFAKQIEKIKVDEVKVININHIRDNIFPEIGNDVFNTLEQGERELIVIATPQGSGKSFFTDELVAEASARGLSSLIASPSIDLEIEHRDRQAGHGTSPLLMASHEKTFGEENPFDLDFPCPDYDNIHYYLDLGVSSTFVKKRFCKNCPFNDVCPYPSQYTKASDPANLIVNISHAHMQAPGSMFKILQRPFDIMVLDESFIDSLIHIYKPEELEYEILRNAEFEWARRLGTWMKDGGYAQGKLTPKLNELERLKDNFEDLDLPFERLRIFIDSYNENLLCNPLSGVKRFFPVPDIPVRILTDATAPMDKIKHILNRDHIKVYGENQILDVRDYHPGNKIIGVLNSSVSRTRLATDERFEELLNFAGYKCITEFQNDLVLITVYKDEIEKSIEYLLEKFPSLSIGPEGSDCRIIIASMKPGVNSFEHMTVQFLFASVHLNAADLIEEEYKMLIVENYYRRRAGLLELSVTYPKEAIKDRKGGVPTKFVPVRKTEMDGVFEYPDFVVPIPDRKYQRWAEQHAVGQGQQAWRIRYKEGMIKRKVLYDFSNQWKPGLLYTEVKTFDQIIAELNSFD